MTIPDTPAYRGLKNFHNPKNLAFRAACISPAPPLVQPIQTRVIRRIHDSSDAQAILVRLWDGLLARGGSVSDHSLATALTEDLCWKTLVLEEVSAIRSLYRHSTWLSHW